MGSYESYKMFGVIRRKFKIGENDPPPYVVEVFARYAEGATHMRVDQLFRFLVDHQQEEGCTVADAEAIVKQVSLRRRLPEPTIGSLSFDDFFYYLFQEDMNGALHSQVYHDMTSPLAHYFIFTGHNSYLTGNQLSSNCSEIPIIKALENGVRGIELDLWPNSAKNDVHVLHGRTLTTPITLIKCLKSIKENAFVTSPYPVIITLEDHLTPELQAKVAKMVTQVFGDMLYYPDQGGLEEFPSPESLKYKIILSTKPPKEYLETKDNNKDAGKELSRDEGLGDSDRDDEVAFDVYKKVSGNLAASEYKRLIGIHAGNAKEGLVHALRTGVDRVGRLSLSEQGLEKAAESQANDLVRFTQKNILRVYPKGTRVTSTNFSPMVGWMHGAQMVAFNMQGYGKSLWMMHGMFLSNGGCGYVKKPDILLRKGPNNEVFDPKLPRPVKQILRVTVYMGEGWRLDFSPTHFDSFSPPDFYTKVRVIGVEADSARRQTKVVEDNWGPYWNEEFAFPLRVPELALLLIQVLDRNVSEKDILGGQTCLRVSELKPGIRIIVLHDKKGRKLKNVKLLLRFKFE